SSLFFITVHGHHRDLHSFPTRRSSDLEVGSVRGRQIHSPAPVHICRPSESWISGRQSCEERWSFLPLKNMLVPGAMPTRTSMFLDRKSTRLNSSHVAISYAVFCLKKKN